MSWKNISFVIISFSFGTNMCKNILTHVQKNYLSSYYIYNSYLPGHCRTKVGQWVAMEVLVLLWVLFFFFSFSCKRKYILLQQKVVAKDNDGKFLMHIISPLFSFLSNFLSTIFLHPVFSKANHLTYAVAAPTFWTKDCLVNPSPSLNPGFDLRSDAILMNCSTFVKHDIT